MRSVLPTLYDILGVKPRAPMEEVRSAYRQLAREYHPDLNPDPKAHERMAQINAAFEVLADPVSRSDYDVSVGHAAYREPSNEGAKRTENVSATVLHRHRQHKTPIYGADFFPDGRLVSCSFDNELILWDQRVTSVLSKSILEGGAISVLRTVGNGLVVAAGATEQSLTCWRIGKGEPKVWRQIPKAWFNSFAISPDGEFLALGSSDTVVRVLNTRNGKQVFAGIGHKDAVTAVTWSPDSKTLASGSGDASVILWEAPTGKKLSELWEVRSTVTALAFSNDRRKLAVAAVDLSVRVFDLGTSKIQKKLFGHTKPVEAMAFHPKGWLLASVGRDGMMGLWSIKSGIGHCLVEASHQALSCVKFSPTGEHLVAGGIDKTLRVWSVAKV